MSFISDIIELMDYQILEPIAFSYQGQLCHKKLVFDRNQKS